MTSSLPITNPSTSFWQSTTLSSDLNSYSSTGTKLPTEADVVVIGAGICGALTALTLLERLQGTGKQVVLLEARDVASGASGRNAGHCRPDAYRGYKGYSSKFNSSEAIKILNSEALVLQLVKSFVEKHNIDCDLVVTDTYDVAMTEAFAAYAKESFDLARAAGTAKDVTFFDGDDAKKATGMECVSAFKWTGASTHPRKLAIAILKLALSLGLQLYTHTPVTSVTSSNKAWSVMTPKGAVKAHQVVYCTNAYSEAVVPELTDKIVPIRIQALTVKPPKEVLESVVMKNTYSCRFTLDEFYSVAPRKDGFITLGTTKQISQWPVMSGAGAKPFKSTDDSSWSRQSSDDCSTAFTKIVTSWPKGATDGFVAGWSGIIGMTEDGLPYIGELPNKPGQFVAAGFGGHGMARIFHCVPSLVNLILGGQWDESLPSSYRVTPKRLAVASKL